MTINGIQGNSGLEVNTVIHVKEWTHDGAVSPSNTPRAPPQGGGQALLNGLGYERPGISGSLDPLELAEARRNELAEEAGEQEGTNRGRMYSVGGYSMDAMAEVGTAHFAPMKTHSVLLPGSPRLTAGGAGVTLMLDSGQVQNTSAVFDEEGINDDEDERSAAYYLPSWWCRCFKTYQRLG